MRTINKIMQRFGHGTETPEEPAYSNSSLQTLDPPTDNIFNNYIHSDRYRQKQNLLDEKIKKLYNYGHDQEIKKKVIPAEDRIGDRIRWDYSQVDDDFSTAAITSEVSRKGNYISKKVEASADTPLEIYLYSLDNLDSDGKPVVRDLYIAQEQKAWSTGCDVSAYGVLLSKLDIRDKLKKRVIGWSHSHAAFNPFFSDGQEGDKENTFTILGSHGLTKRIRVFDNTYNGEGYNGVEYEVRYSPAIVFNARNAQPFVAIAVEYTRLYDRQKVSNINENARLRVINEINGIDLDRNSIDKQILERVSFNGRTLSEIAGRHYRPEQVKKAAKIPLSEEEKYQLVERVTKLEDEYGHSKEEIERLKERNERLERRNIRLKRLYKSLSYRRKKPKKWKKSLINLLKTKIW